MLTHPQDAQLNCLALKDLNRNCPLLPGQPDWLIICGLGTRDEVRSCHLLWPGTKVVGVDFDTKVLEACKPVWNKNDLVFDAALSDELGTADARMNAATHSTLHPQMVREPGAEVRKVETLTLDSLDELHGPFDESVLWVDAEGSDPRIIKGARGMLSRGAVQAAVVEVWTARPDLVKEYSGMRSLFLACGMHLVDVLNPQWWGHNEIWLRDDLADAVIKAG